MKKTDLHERARNSGQANLTDNPRVQDYCHTIFY